MFNHSQIKSCIYSFESKCTDKISRLHQCDCLTISSTPLKPLDRNNSLTYIPGLLSSLRFHPLQKWGIFKKKSLKQLIYESSVWVVLILNCIWFVRAPSKMDIITKYRTFLNWPIISLFQRHLTYIIYLYHPRALNTHKFIFKDTALIMCLSCRKIILIHRHLYFKLNNKIIQLSLG